MKDEERYDIQGKLGEGGRGAVYLAKDRQLNRTVAIKRLLAEEKDADAAYEALLNESRALSSINNPHIVRVFDVCQDEDGPYVVMEHLKGKTLHEVVANAPLLEHDFLEIAEQALEALIAAHQVHLLHRDIKPGNLMLTWLPSGRFNLKLLDFGLAKFSSAPSVQTVAHGQSVMGSIYFMAPEQFERAPLDQRTDLYSLGCVFFFALTGDYPFNGENVTAVMASHLQGTHHDLQALRPDLSPSLCDWVTSFIARTPDQRPSSAQKALDALAETHQGPLTTTSPQPIAPQLLTGPVHIDPLTGQIPVPPTGQIPVQTAPTTLHSSSGIPLPLVITMGVLSLLILTLGTAIYFRPEPGPPLPISPAPDRALAEHAAKQAPTSGRISSDPEATPAKTDPERKPAQVFRNRDKNKDGKLSESEFVGKKTGKALEQQKKLFQSLDKDKDGFLSLYEFDPL